MLLKKKKKKKKKKDKFILVFLYLYICLRNQKRNQISIYFAEEPVLLNQQKMVSDAFITTDNYVFLCLEC